MISIIIGTYNNDWLEAHRHYFERAMASAHSQTIPVEVLWEHGPTLAQARNRGAENASGERLVFLDADDWLDENFCELIVEPEDVLQPLTHFGDSPVSGYIAPREDLLDGNHLIVGCPVNRKLFIEAGGFDEWPIYEDWALWLKLQRFGARFGKTKGVYHIEVRPGSRNQLHYGNTFEEIRRTYR